MTDDTRARAAAEAIVNSCHCQQGPEPSPCDGWLQHRKCASLADAVAQARQEQWRIDNGRCSAQLLEAERRHIEEMAQAVKERDAYWAEVCQRELLISREQSEEIALLKAEYKEMLDHWRGRVQAAVAVERERCAKDMDVVACALNGGQLAREYARKYREALRAPGRTS